MGGAPESPRQFDGAIQTLRYMLEDLGAACTDVVTMGGSDKAGLSDRPDIQHALETLAQKLKA